GSAIGTFRFRRRAPACRCASATKSRRRSRSRARSKTMSKKTDVIKHKQRRSMRARPTPKWIALAQELDEMGRRRTLMVLSVLSGERPVTEVIAQAQISRGTYYQLEERALRAMIAALTPTSSASADEDSTQIAESPARTIAALQTKLARLERIKRRQERM